MRNKVFMLLIGMFVFGTFGYGQTLEELKKMKDEKAAQLSALQGEVNGLQKQIDEFPGWKVGGLGIVGFDLNGNSDWFAIDDPQSSSDALGFNFSGFANLDEDKLFWRNLLLVNLRRTNSKQHPDSTSVTAITDALDLSSLFGYKLSEKLALSAEGRYTTTVLNFNDPGKLLLSAGVTWTPIQDLVVIIHPLGYEFNFPSGEFSSAPGAKIGATYAREIVPGVAWSSSLNAFLAYSGDDDSTPVKSAGDLSNWTWINGFAFSVFKGIGVGLNVGLRNDKQLALSKGLSNNPLQSYYTLGLSYTL
ncbi:MAG: DUF3078 domain-containing protein [Bacteroidota bacterium]